MHDEILNITNGDYFNSRFLSEHGGIAVPFREAMMDGDAAPEIFSGEFIRARCMALNVGEREYRSKMCVCELLTRNDYPKLCLWFGKDTFCQTNLLTLLAYLEQIGYRGELLLNYIDDGTLAVTEHGIRVALGKYREIYRDVLLSKRMPRDVGVLDGRAIGLYFDYRSDDGALADLVRKNIGKSKTELIRLLLEQSTDYGLSDLQAERLIDSVLQKG